MLTWMIDSLSRDGVSIWIDEDQALRLSGQETNLFILQDGQVGELLQTLETEAGNGSQPSIAVDVSLLNVTWQAPPHYKYRFRLRSYTRKVMRTPTLNIPEKGIIPVTESGFQIELPCKSDGFASFLIALKIIPPHRRHTPVIQLAQVLRKTCSMDGNNHTRL
ncbi:wnt inhibitory factor 1-like [Acanthaster planci]|uniref:Wnt inhibitory factor 1-like n=1 Tax=Acanthaster planci TaxID=133434 RepID=A0A8B7YU33_ACAPL|nr:wnt inhibitory factor 1-like [Acanthaster planci]